MHQGVQRSLSAQMSTVCWFAVYPAAAVDSPAAFRLRKHSRQYTGRPCVGLKGTVVSRPHCEQVVMVSVLPAPDDPACRLLLHALQRLGSFLKFLSWKKCCSPAVKTNSAPHSEHLRIRSWNSAITPTWFSPKGCGTDRWKPVRPVVIRFPGVTFSGSACGPAPASPAFSLPASSRRSAS